MAATAGMMITGIQTVSTFASQQREARAVRAQGRFEQLAFDRNAQLADLQAQDALLRGEMSTHVRGQQTREDIGTARASYAGQGVALDTGTPVDVQADIARLGALDIATIRNNAAREAWGFTTQADDLRFRGDLAARGADLTAMGLRADAVNTLITGAGKTYGLYRQKTDNTAPKSVPPKKAPSAPRAPRLIRRGVDAIPSPSGRASV
jgi:hypothetical protein